jgi:hypothetical protein
VRYQLLQSVYGFIRLPVKQRAIYFHSVLKTDACISHRIFIFGAETEIMHPQKINLRFSVITLMVILATVSRLLPHIFNFTMFGATCLFGAAYFSKKWQALVIPVVAAYLSDLYLNNVVYKAYFPEFTWFSGGLFWKYSSLLTYASYIVVVLIGFALFKKITPARIIAGSLISTALFFLVTNFASWPNNPLYTQDFKGLMLCFEMGLPFIKGTLFGDLFYSGVLFGSFALLQRSYPALQKKNYSLAA